MGRWTLLLGIVNRPIPRSLLLVWGLVSTYDVVMSQFIPPDVAQGMPKAWQILLLGEPYLPGWPFWAWLLILAALLVALSFEYALHAAKRVSITDQHPAAPLVGAAPLALSEAALSAIGLPVAHKYALPEEAKARDIRSLTYKELGALVIKLSNDIGEMVTDTMRDRPNSQVAYFNQIFASRFFWLYGEAYRRGHRDEALDAYYRHPALLKNVSHLNQQLRGLGHRLPLYLDS